ncbi:hypothetical protein [Brevundimonas sp. GCM10030266]|uniref:hypothetical protein n=1 Tax=Brevundimonas sp. GCM10030266 TaxID=3273386 RepID=UPI00360EA1F0
MTDPKPEDWTDLAEVWTAPAETPEPAPELARAVRRRATLATLNFHLEAWGAVAAGGVAVWVALRHDAPVLGLAGAAFGVFALAATLWARRGARPGEADTPAAALHAAIRQARSGVHWARAGQAICAGALAFILVLGLSHPSTALPVIYLISFAFIAAMAAFYERHARRCRARITRHQAALAELE